MNFKVCDQAQVKILEDGYGSFVGYGSVFGNVDRDNEIVAKGAFVNLEEFLHKGFGAVGHDWGGLPVATIKDARQDDHGLLIEMDYHSTGAAQDARTVVKERLDRGKFVGLSIGYRVLKSDMEEEARLLKEIELFEVSIVTVPANPLAGIGSAKDSRLPASLTLDEHSETTLAVVREFKHRLSDLRDLRAKEGRTLSDANRQRLTQHITALEEVCTDLKGLLDETQPKASQDEILREVARFEAQRASLNRAFVV